MRDSCTKPRFEAGLTGTKSGRFLDNSSYRGQQAACYVPSKMMKEVLPKKSADMHQFPLRDAGEARVPSRERPSYTAREEQRGRQRGRVHLPIMDEERKAAIKLTNSFGYRSRMTEEAWNCYLACRKPRTIWEGRHHHVTFFR